MSIKQSKSSLLLFIAAIIWGVAFVAQSAGMSYVGPFTFNAVRSILGGIVLIPCIFILNRVNKKYPDESSTQNIPQDAPKDLLIGGLTCGFLMFVSIGLQQIGLMHTTVAKAGFITSLYIIMVPILGIFLKRKVEFKIWISVMIALAGLYLLCMKGSLSINKGDFFILLCSLTFAMHIMVVDHFIQKVSGTKLSCIQFLFAGFLSGILMFLFEKPDISSILSAWLPLIYAGILSCGVAYTFQIIGQRGTDPTVASLILSLESVISVLAGWVLLNQKLTAREMSGCVLMFVAIILAQVNPDILKKKKTATN